MRWLEHLVGPPMAAPETAHMRHLRMFFVGSATTCGIGIMSISPIATFIGRAAAGGALLGAVLAALASGTVYFIKKDLADGAWLIRREIEPEGEGR